MLLEDVSCDDDLHGIETSHMECLRRNLLETRLQHPIKDHNATEHTEGLRSESDRKRARVEDSAHAEE